LIFFSNFIARYPWTAWATAEDILNGVDTGRTEFLKCQPFFLISVMVKQQKNSISDTQKGQLQEIIPKVRQAFEKLLSSPQRISAPRLREVMTNFSLIASISTAFYSHKKMLSLWSPDQLEIFLNEKVLTVPQYQSNAIKTTCNSLLNTLRGTKSDNSSQVVKKRKLEEKASENLPESTKEIKKNEKPKNGQSQKKKSHNRLEKKRKEIN